MDARSLIAALNELALDERAEWADELAREIDAMEQAFAEQSRRLTMTAADLEMTYSI